MTQRERGRRPPWESPRKKSSPGTGTLALEPILFDLFRQEKSAGETYRKGTKMVSRPEKRKSPGKMAKQRHYPSKRKRRRGRGILGEKLLIGSPGCLLYRTAKARRGGGGEKKTKQKKAYGKKNPRKKKEKRMKLGRATRSEVKGESSGVISGPARGKGKGAKRTRIKKRKARMAGGSARSPLRPVSRKRREAEEEMATRKLPKVNDQKNNQRDKGSDCKGPSKGEHCPTAARGNKGERNRKKKGDPVTNVSPRLTKMRGSKKRFPPGKGVIRKTSPRFKIKTGIRNLNISWKRKSLPDGGSAYSTGASDKTEDGVATGGGRVRKENQPPLN